MKKRYPHPSSDIVSKRMRSNPGTGTKPEIALRSALHALGLRFRKDFPIAVEGRRVRPDVVFTRRKVAVYLDGCFWHRCPEHGTRPTSNSWYWGPKLDRNVERDRETDSLLDAAGWRVIRVWEHEDPAVAAQQIAAAVREGPGADRDS